MNQGFQPRFIFENELGDFGLPTSDQVPNIMNLVDSASNMIDEHCGRTDADATGSLVFSTYSERLLLQAERNIFRVSFRPLVAISAATQSTLSNLDSSVSGNYYNTGFTPNTTLFRDGVTLSPIISCSGRYGYTRRSSQRLFPDYYGLGFNPLQVAGVFGGPPEFTALDVASIDFDEKTGELWIPSGLYPTPYTEIEITYNSGFDPTNMPRTIKHATSALVKNLLLRGGGTTGLRGYSAQGISSTFTDDVIDARVDSMLQQYKTVIAT